jgi:hypothetical protein
MKEMKMDKTVSNLSEKLKETETLRRLERVRPREEVRPLGKRGKIATDPIGIGGNHRWCRCGSHGFKKIRRIHFLKLMMLRDETG